MSTFSSSPLPTRSAFTRADELLEERVVDGPVHEQPRGGRAALAGRAEGAPHRAVDRQVHVGVVHHEDRVLAAHLQVQALERRRAGLRDPPADLGRARVRDDLHVGVLDERIAHLAARAHDDVEDARREAGLLEHARQRHDRGRGVRGRLDDDRVAGDQRRHRLPRRDRHREVPRRDQRADADRLPDAHRELVGQLRGRREAEEAAAFARRQVGHVDRFLHVAARLGEDLAHLARHQPRQLFLVALEDLAGRVEDLGAARRRSVLPAREGLLRRRDGRVHVPLVALGEQADEVIAVGGVAVFERLARGGRNPLAADEVVLRFDCDLRGHQFSSAFCLDRGRGRGRRAADMATFPWSWAPSAMTTLGALTLPWTDGGREKLRPLVGPDLAVDPAADHDGPGLEVSLELAGRRDRDPPLTLMFPSKRPWITTSSSPEISPTNPRLRPDDRRRRPAGVRRRRRAIGRRCLAAVGLAENGHPPSERPASLAKGASAPDSGQLERFDQEDRHLRAIRRARRAVTEGILAAAPADAVRREILDETGGEEVGGTSAKKSARGRLDQRLIGRRDYHWLLRRRGRRPCAAEGWSAGGLMTRCRQRSALSYEWSMSWDVDVEHGGDRGNSAVRFAELDHRAFDLHNGVADDSSRISVALDGGARRTLTSRSRSGRRRLRICRNGATVQETPRHVRGAALWVAMYQVLPNGSFDAGLVVAIRTGWSAGQIVRDPPLDRAPERDIDVGDIEVKRGGRSGNAGTPDDAHHRVRVADADLGVEAASRRGGHPVEDLGAEGALQRSPTSSGARSMTRRDEEGDGRPGGRGRRFVLSYLEFRPAFRGQRRADENRLQARAKVLAGRPNRCAVICARSRTSSPRRTGPPVRRR